MITDFKILTLNTLLYLIILAFQLDNIYGRLLSISFWENKVAMKTYDFNMIVCILYSYYSLLIYILYLKDLNFCLQLII